LPSARRDIGERYFDDERGYLQEVSGLTAELEALEEAFSTLDAREKAAQVDLQRATARDLRHQEEKETCGIGCAERPDGKVIGPAQHSRGSSLHAQHFVCPASRGSMAAPGKSRSAARISRHSGVAT
jgi:hypothetical protein